MDEPTLVELPVSELLERFAERTPAPGGGSAAALACALAAALVEMAARYGQTPEGSAAIAERAGALRSHALALAQVDLAAFAAVLAADTASQRERARRDAAQPPLEIAAAAAELADLGASVAGGGSPHLVGDATAAVLLAEAACRAGAELVAINLADFADDPRRGEAAGHAKRAARARAGVLGTASS